jgi:hypothetical protein
MIEKLCPDGMVFNDYSPDQEKCDLPYNIDCSQRPKLRKYFNLVSDVPCQRLNIIRIGISVDEKVEYGSCFVHSEYFFVIFGLCLSMKDMIC